MHKPIDVIYVSSTFNNKLLEILLVPTISTKQFNSFSSLLLSFLVDLQIKSFKNSIFFSIVPLPNYIIYDTILVDFEEFKSRLYSIKQLYTNSQRIWILEQEIETSRNKIRSITDFHLTDLRFTSLHLRKIKSIHLRRIKAHEKRLKNLNSVKLNIFSASDFCSFFYHQISEKWQLIHYLDYVLPDLVLDQMSCSANLETST